ncbi:MAG: hypothetical protein OXN88_13470 [Chloroflexota bacterium]|nr:hypothetical protein [Chloroflexota bacterium]
MKTRPCAIMMVFLSLTYSIIGQSNCYPHDSAYLTGSMNIRSSYSASSRIISTARAGDSFVVSQSRRGAAWCWLDIGRGWLAKTSRVSPTPPSHPSSSQTNQPANVDNCCFVDRQCQTQQEWVNGYWAFKNGQCAAAAQTSSAASAHVDNCCFIGWQCHNDDDWSRGYHAFQNNQCGGNAISNPGALNLPDIVGSDWFRQQILDAFEFLRANSPKWFNYTASKIRQIVEMPELTSKYGREAYAQVNARTGRVQVSSASLREGSWPLHNALIHEACHVHQWDSGKYDSWSWNLSFDLEPECYEVQIQALSEMMPDNRLIRRLRCYAERHPFESFCAFSWFR